MALFTWKDEYAISEPRIDAQHRRLFELAGNLHSAMLAGQAKNVLGGLLNELIAYTREHFSTEESLMRRCSYPDFQRHKIQHDDLTFTVLAFRRDFEAGKVALSVELLGFLKEWLAHHIAESDRRVGEHLRRAA